MKVLLGWSYPSCGGACCPGGAHDWGWGVIPARSMHPGGVVVGLGDGSIRFVSLKGKILDEFNHGVSLAGLASVTIDGKPALVIATTDSLEAWSVELK